MLGPVLDLVNNVADPVVITAIITAIGTQLVAVVKAFRCQKATAASVGSPNGLGTVHEALKTINGKLDGLSSRVAALETPPGSPPSPKGS